MDCTFLGFGDDMLVVLMLREEESGANEAAAVTEEGLAGAPVKIVIKCLEPWGLKRTVLVSDGEPARQALLTAVKLARQEETVVTGNQVQRVCGECAPVGAGSAENLDGVD